MEIYNTDIVSTDIVPTDVFATNAVVGVVTCRVAPMWASALEQSAVRMSLPALDAHAAPRTKDVFGRPGIRTKEPPA